MTYYLHAPSAVEGLLITCYLLLFAYLSLKNLKWGIYLIGALLPTYLIRFTILGIPATLLEGMIVILFIIWLVKEKVSLNPLVWIENIKEQGAKSKEQNAIPHTLRLPIVLLLAASTISVFVSPDLRAALGIWKAYFIEPLMFLLIFVYNVKTTDEIKKVIRCLGLTVLAIGVFAIIQKLTGALIPNPFWAAEATRRVTTFFGYPNANALFLVPIILLTVGNLISDFLIKVFSFKFLVLSFLIIVLGTLTIIWTQSAGGLIAVIAGIIALALMYKKIRLSVLLLILILTTMAVFSPMVKSEISKTLVQISSTHLPLNASDFQIRAQQWRETLAMLADTPIFGAGLAGYQTLVAPYHQNPHVEIYLYPHNFFLNFWTETGLLGLISIIWILIVFFALIYKAQKKQPTIWTLITASAMMALLVQGKVDEPYFKNDLAILFWIIVGIVIVLYNANSSRMARE